MAVATRLAVALLLSLSIVAPVAAQVFRAGIPLLFADRADLDAATRDKPKSSSCIDFHFRFTCATSTCTGGD